jgi:fumarylacetoacetate (FAA) hydrolase family protein
LIGRVWDPAVDGPCPVLVREEGLLDLSPWFPTVRDLCEEEAPASAIRSVVGEGDGLRHLRRVTTLEAAVAATNAADKSSPRLLAPVDLQTLKAAGVTFAVSLMERVIEEGARGDLDAASALRTQVLEKLGDLGKVVPGSKDAARLKEVLTSQGAWSQYLEVGLGPDAEIFTKAPTLAAVGTLAQIGVPVTSTWNNPEPEVALAISSAGRVVGAMLGNDVNLRDVEGRSALLLPQAKDNTASCALGPFLRLFDNDFTLDSVRSVNVELQVMGQDGFQLRDFSPMSQISRDPEQLVGQLFRTHYYPDGVVLMLGTLFAPVIDRDNAGQGFTHKPGDVVRIWSRELGALINEVRYCHECEPWSFGLRSLMSNLARRGLLSPCNQPPTHRSGKDKE